MYNTYMAIEPMCIKFLAINPFDVAHTVRGAFMCFDEALVSECLCGPLLCIVLYIQTRKYENCIEPKLCGLFTLRGRASRSKKCVQAAQWWLVTVNAIHFPLQKAIMSFDIICRCKFFFGKHQTLLHLMMISKW